MAYDDCHAIIADTAKELGLTISAADAADPFGASDSNILQLLALLTSTGQEINDSYPWSFRDRTAIITTVNGTGTYDLEDDYGEMIDETWWNRTTSLPMMGPISARQWQELQALVAYPTTRTLFRVTDNFFHVYPTPGATVLTLAYEYRSSWWVTTAGQDETDKDVPSVYSDHIFLPRLLIVRGLKLAFKRTKGFDTTAAQAEFDTTLADEKRKDTQGQTRNLAQGGGFRLIDWRNVPDTGFGS